MKQLPPFALSIHSHWAWAIIHGDKRIENRTWRTRYRGPLLIHASQTIDREILANLPDAPQPCDLTRGAFIGVVDVLDCVPFSETQNAPYAVGPWCWLLSNPRPIQPVEWKGTTGLFRLPAKLARRIQILP